MDTNSLVSICTPIYNHEKYLPDYFRSIMEQTYNDIELILIDDKSTDDSLTVVKEYLPLLEKRFKRVFVCENEENLGVTKTCNKLVDFSKGAYIKILASDDMLHPTAIEKMVTFMEKNNQIKLCLTNGYFVDEDYSYGSSINKYEKLYKSDLSSLLQNSRQLKYTLLDHNIIFAPAVMYKKEIYDLYGKYDERMKFEDYEYWIRMSDKILFGYLDEILVYYRIAKNSQSNYRNNKKKFIFILTGDVQARMKHIRRLQNDEREKWIERTYNNAIRLSLENGYKDIAFNIYMLSKKKNIKSNYSMKDILLRKI